MFVHGKDGWKPQYDLNLGRLGHHGVHRIILIEGTRLKLLPFDADSYVFRENDDYLLDSITVSYGD